VRFCPWFAISMAIVSAGLSAETARRPAIRLPVPDNTVRDAALIFSGTVLTVQRPEPEKTGGVATTQITFRVLDAIRGVRRGQILQIREWEGLWQAGERYQPGEHVLLFLYPVSRLGLTSPVGGSGGRLRVDHAGHVVLKTRTEDHYRTVDVRILSAAIRRAAKEYAKE
jgi:hypothetical protein